MGLVDLHEFAYEGLDRWRGRTTTTLNLLYISNGWSQDLWNLNIHSIRPKL